MNTLIDDAASCAPARLISVAKRYANTLALDDVSLEIEPGRVTALLGPNGAGKTTAIALMIGLAMPDGGRAELFGESPQRVSARRNIGVMLQSAALPDTLRVRELLTLTSCYYLSPRPAADVARMTGIADLLGRPYGRLSGGQQRRVQFALAICGSPRLLVLDEPTVGLDTAAREALWKTVRDLAARGCAVLLTTHYLEEAEALADRVVVLARGRIVTDGTVEQIRMQTGRRRIRCISALTPEAVRDWEGVGGVSRHGEWLEIEARAAEPVVRRLLETDPAARELEVRRAGLAEALAQVNEEAA